MSQKVTEGEGKIHDFDKKRSKSSEFYHLELGLFPSITHIVAAMNTLIDIRHNHRTKTVPHLEPLEERKRFRFTLQMKDLVSDSLVRTTETFSHVMLAMKLER